MCLEDALFPNAAAIIDDVSKMECIKPYCLIGGTALAMQIYHRLSEDLDFCIWPKNKEDKPQMEWWKIRDELSQIGTVRMDLLGDEHCDFFLNGVKLTFFIDKVKSPPLLQRKEIMNNLFVADVLSIAVMKVNMQLHRSKFRDYYDLYSILKEGASFAEIIHRMGVFIRHAIKSKQIFAALTNSERVANDPNFSKLNPKYHVTKKDIELFMVEQVNQIMKDKQINDKTK